jgi:thymidine kinase
MRNEQHSTRKQDNGKKSAANSTQAEKTAKTSRESLKQRSDVIDVASDILALLGEGEELEAALLVEVDEALAFHLLQDFHDVGIRAVDMLCKGGRVDFRLRVFQFNEHHRGLFAEEHFEYFLVLHV